MKYGARTILNYLFSHLHLYINDRAIMPKLQDVHWPQSKFLEMSCFPRFFRFVSSFCHHTLNSFFTRLVDLDILTGCCLFNFSFQGGGFNPHIDTSVPVFTPLRSLTYLGPNDLSRRVLKAHSNAWMKDYFLTHWWKLFYCTYATGIVNCYSMSWHENYTLKNNVLKLHKIC